MKRANEKGARAGQADRVVHAGLGENQGHISEKKLSNLNTGEPYRMNLRPSRMYSGRRQGEGRDTKA